MSWIVVDASVTLSWRFPDAQTPSAIRVLDMLKAGNQALRPAFWCFEVHNSLNRKPPRLFPDDASTIPGSTNILVDVTVVQRLLCAKM